MNRIERWMERLLPVLLWVSLALFSIGCSAARSPRVTVVTGTTIGLKATPGDGNTRPPQVTLAYKRAEIAVIPTKGAKATKSSPTTEEKTTKDSPDVDAFSTLAAFFFTTQWFGDTEIASFIATGYSARDIQGTGSKFGEVFAQATIGVVPEEIQARRKKLIEHMNQLTEEQAKEVLDLAGRQVKAGKTAKESLQDAIKDAQTDALLLRLESAFQRIR